VARDGKKYLAVVHGKCRGARKPSPPTWQRTRLTSSIPPPIRKRKAVHTAYRVLKQTKDFALLEVDLLTGRKNQIRVHLAGIGHPIVGDKKYGKGAHPTHV